MSGQFATLPYRSQACCLSQQMARLLCSGEWLLWNRMAFEQAKPIIDMAACYTSRCVCLCICTTRSCLCAIAGNLCLVYMQLYQYSSPEQGIIAVCIVCRHAANRIQPIQQGILVGTFLVCSLLFFLTDGDMYYTCRFYHAPIQNFWSVILGLVFFQLPLSFWLIRGRSGQLASLWTRSAPKESTIEMNQYSNLNM